MQIKLTLDTNVIENELVRAVAVQHNMEIAVVSVTAREVQGHRYEELLHHFIVVPETGVWGESQWGQFEWGSTWNDGLLANILPILANGSFPFKEKVTALTAARRRQLRDGMILAAHAREKRHIFVTDDRKAFVAHERRQRFERLLGTRILTSEEFFSEYGAWNDESGGTVT